MKKALKNKIRQEFCSSKIPILPPIGESDELDYPEVITFSGKSWDDLSLNEIEDNFLAFFKFDQNSFEYYFGALMEKMLSANFAQSNVLDILSFTEPMTDEAEREYLLYVGPKLQKFNSRQLGIIIEFLRWREKELDEHTVFTNSHMISLLQNIRETK